MQEKGQHIRPRVMSGRGFAVAYTAIFCITSYLTFLPYLQAGTSLIWPTDGLFQHYNAFVYLGGWYRSIIKNLLAHHEFVIPMWEFGIGYGNDTITSLAHYMLADPFILFSVLTPTRFAEVGYVVSIVARMFCAGLTFALYAHQMRCTNRGALCGAIAYAFCGYALFFSGSHTYFISALVWLPLLFCGVERIFSESDPRIYIVATCISLASSFYFYYMHIIFVILYVVVRGFELHHGHLGKVFKSGLLVALNTLVGAAMAAIVFLPVIVAYLGSSRGASTYVFPPVSTSKEYVGYLVSLITLGNARYSGFIGLSPVVLAGVAVSLTQRREATWAKVYLLVLMIFLVFPFFGYALNGFGYVSNRWVFCIAFVSCFLFANASDGFEELGTGQKVVSAAIVCFYAAVCLLSGQVTDVFMDSYYLLGLSVVAIMGSGLLERLVTKRGASLQTSKAIIGSVTMVLVVMGVLVLSRQEYIEGMGGFAAKHVTRGEATSRLSKGSVNPRNLKSENEFFRIDTGRLGREATNPPIWWNQSTTMQYWSIVPGTEKDFLMLNSCYEELTYRTRGLLSRSLLLPLFSSEYFFTKGDYSYQVPYGYDFVETLPNGYNLYQTDLFLPLGYSYDTYVTESEFASMSMAERQQAMLQCAVMEDDIVKVESAVEHVVPDFTDQKLDFDVVDIHGASLKDNAIVVTEQNAWITLRVDCPADTEMYLCFTGMHFTPRGGTADATISASSNGRNAAPMHLYTSASQYEHGRKDYLLNLYYSSEKRDEVTVHLSKVGKYTYTDMSVLAQPLSALPNEVEALRADALEDISINANTITGSFAADKDKVLCFSIPYTDGWHLSVDGVERELTCVNSMFLGTVLEAGSHDILLAYETPHLREGALASGIGFAVFVLLCFLVKRRRTTVVYEDLE